MSEKDKKINWSDKCWKEMLIYQRKYLWLEDTIAKLSLWLKMKSCMNVVDVGCGLGYLGYTYWPYFGKGGSYFGVDVSLELIREAQRLARDWAKGGKANFVAGDAYKLPFQDGSADLVMCHILLIHLDKPDLALAEMVRVAKPGGLVVCKEPDNLATLLTLRYPSIPEFGIEEQLLFLKVAVICNRGRIKLGQGDNSLGPKIPRMMKDLDLTTIGIRINDRAYYVEPPYRGPLQQYHLEWAKNKWLNEKNYKTLTDRERKEFEAGGGYEKDFERYKKIKDRIKLKIREQVKNKSYFECGSGDIYIIKGRKPEN